jgi:hypothetical protein
MALQTASFATAQEMEQRSQGVIPATHPFLEKELKAATRRIRDACGWHIATVEALTFERVGPFAEHVWLPAMEITSITAATVDGIVADVAAVEFDKQTGWTSLCGRRRSVTFTAGFAEVPEDLVTLTLELAAGGLGSPVGISREQAGGVSVTYTRTSGALQPDDHDRLAPYKLGWLP